MVQVCPQPRQPLLVGPHPAKLEEATVLIADADFSHAVSNCARSFLQVDVVRQISERRVALPERKEHKDNSVEDERGDDSAAYGDAVVDGIGGGGGTTFKVGHRGGEDWHGVGMSDAIGGNT